MLKKIELEEEEAASLYIWQDFVLKFLVTLDVNYSAVLERRTVKLMCFVQPDLIYINPEELRNWDSTGQESSEILSIVFEIEPFYSCTTLIKNVTLECKERAVTNQKPEIH